jgi:hypothetical protein
MYNLNEQQALVERKAIEAERTRTELARVQASFMVQLRRRITSPSALLVAFGAGLAWGVRRSHGPAAVLKGGLSGRLFAAGTWLAGRLNTARNLSKGAGSLTRP